MVLLGSGSVFGFVVLTWRPQCPCPTTPAQPKTCPAGAGKGGTRYCSCWPPGLMLFGAAAGALYYVLQPVTLRIAVGPPGSDDHKLIQAMAETFARDRSGVRLSPIITRGSGGKPWPSRRVQGRSRGRARRSGNAGDAETVAIVRKNVVVLWSPSGLPGKGSKKQPAPKIKAIDDLEGHRVGVIGRTPANVALLRVILTESGVDPDKVAVTQFGTDQIKELARDTTIDAFMTVGPLDSKITAEAIAATARARGEPKFLPIDVSDAIALKHPLYESEEIPGSVFSASPAWPDDKIDTVSVNHVIVARKALSKRRSRHSPAKCSPFAIHLPRKCRAPRTSKSRTPTRTPSCPCIAGAAAYHRRQRTHLPGQIQRLLLVRDPGSLRARFGRRLVASLSETGRTGAKHGPPRQGAGPDFQGAHGGNAGRMCWRWNARSIACCARRSPLTTTARSKKKTYRPLASCSSNFIMPWPTRRAAMGVSAPEQARLRAR